MAALARSGSRAIATAAVAISTHLSSQPSLADNGENSDHNNNNFRQLSVQEVHDTARTIFRGKSDSNASNGNLSIPANNTVQVHHQNIPPIALALGEQFAKDPKVQLALYEHICQKWSLVGKGGLGVEREIHLSDDEDEEPGLRSPILSDIEDSDYSHLSRNQVIISPELFAAVHQILPPSTATTNSLPSSPIHPPAQQVSSAPSTSTISSNSNDGKEEGGVIDRFVRWIGSFFSPNSPTTQQSPYCASCSASSSVSSAASSSSSTSTSSDPLSSIKNFVGSIEIYQMAIAVAAVIVFVGIFRRPPPKFF